MEYIHDGTYGGFLTAIFRLFADKNQASGRIAAPQWASALPFGETVAVEADENQADRVEAKLAALDIAETVYKAYLYEDEDMAAPLVAFIRLAIAQNQSPANQRYDPAVHAVLRAERRVSTEISRFLQFTRFVKAESPAGKPALYIADIDPAYDILPFLIRHFTARLNDQCFILRDTRRKYALVWDTNRWHLSALPEINRPSLPQDGVFEALWRTYFENIAIPWRKNPKLQQHFIPLRYRKDMTEFQ